MRGYYQELKRQTFRFLVSRQQFLLKRNKEYVILEGNRKLEEQEMLTGIASIVFNVEHKTNYVYKHPKGGYIITRKKTSRKHRKITVPSKTILIVAKEDLGLFDQEHKILADLRIESKNDFLFSCMLRYEKLNFVHFDTLSSKIAHDASLKGVNFVEKDYAKEFKKIAQISYRWLVEQKEVTDNTRIWSKEFSQLLCSMGFML